MEPPTGIQVVPVLFGDQPLLTQVKQPQHEWSFSGPIMNKVHHDFFIRWVYSITARKRVQDHFGRAVTVAVLGMSYTPDVNNVGRYWNGEYEVRVQNLGPVSSATVGDIWS